MRASGTGIAIRVMSLYRYVLKHGSKNHKITMSELLKFYEQEGFSADRRVVYSDITTLYDCGIDLIYDEHAKGYFFTNPQFEPYELRLLVDGIQSMKFITQEEAKKITGKIKELADIYTEPTLKRSSIVADRIRSMNNAVIKDLDKIYDAIETDRQVSFRYAHYLPNSNKEKKYVKNGEPLTVSPYSVYWNNGNCYLYAFLAEKQQFRYFRIDRMERITVSAAKKREGKDLFDKDELTGRKKPKVFNMYKGKKSCDVRIRFTNNLADQVIDEFGKDIVMFPTDERHFMIQAAVSVSPTFYAWVSTFGRSAKILGPEEVVDGMKEFLQRAADMYKNDGET